MSNAVHLQNEKLCVDVLPDNGGRIASIRCRRTGTEFLLKGSSYEATANFADSALFEESDCAGWDECLRTISPSFSDSPEFQAPDHGDLWRRPWEILKQTESQITLSAECLSRPLALTRSLHLESTRVRLDYSITNNGERPEAFLYACHPLFAVDAGDRVLLPSEVDTVRLHYSRGERIGTPGMQLRWPALVRGSAETAIDRVGDLSEGSAEMLYAAAPQIGVCALYRTRRQQAIVMRFTHRNLPFLGLWICNGGWPENKKLRKQHAVAFEPTVAPFGSLAEAIAAGAAPVLEPKAKITFSIEVEIVGSELPCTYEEILALLEYP